MNCDVFTSIYLRANGQFSCGCDAGHDISLGEASAAWTPQALFGGRAVKLARAMFRRSQPPWTQACHRCIGLEPTAPFAHDRPAKQLRQVLFEPSFACALRCPSCPRAELAPARTGPVFLSVALWRRVLQTLRDEGYAVGSFLTTGLGDPLTHPRLEELVDAIREFFPLTPILINTNGNYRFDEVFVRGSHPDRFLVSVDGLHQRSYEQYRINGDVELALEFMRKARQLSGPRPAVEWKYILFRHTDGDDELLAAQAKAAELNLDSLQFVFTHTREKSLRYTPANVHELPIAWSGAYPDGTCHLRFRRRQMRALTPTRGEAQPAFRGANRVHLQIDSCDRWSDRLLVRGWAMGMDGRPPQRLEVRINDASPSHARVGVVREDVWQALPALANRTAGFDAMLPLGPASDRAPVDVTVTYITPGNESFALTVSYEHDPRGPIARSPAAVPAAI